MAESSTCETVWPTEPVTFTIQSFKEGLCGQETHRTGKQSPRQVTAKGVAGILESPFLQTAALGAHCFSILEDNSAVTPLQGRRELTSELENVGPWEWLPAAPTNLGSWDIKGRESRAL